MNPDKFRDVNYFGAMELIAWVTSVEGQEIIGDYKVEGDVLFFPDAVTP